MSDRLGDYPEALALIHELPLMVGQQISGWRAPRHKRKRVASLTREDVLYLAADFYRSLAAPYWIESNEFGRYIEKAEQAERVAAMMRPPQHLVAPG